MNPQIAYESVQQTLRILIPEFIVLAAGVAMMTAAPFFRWPRRTLVRDRGRGADRGLAGAAGGLGLQQTDMYASVALNDSLGFYGRLVVLLSGLILLALAHDEPADDTAGEFFGALLDDQRGGDAGDDRQRAGLPFRGPRAGQHPDVPAALPHAPDVHDPGDRDQVLLPQHLLLGTAALRAGVPVRRGRGQQSQGAGHPVVAALPRSRTRSLA